jgi:hypothetical protein
MLLSDVLVVLVVVVVVIVVAAVVDVVGSTEKVAPLYRTISLDQHEIFA